MILLTGATGLVGSALLRRLTLEHEPVRCLVRDPRRLGAERVRVQIAMGDLSDPLSFRHALRGVKTVIHLAASIRDQDHGSIEELNGAATWRLVQAAEREGIEHFVFFSALEARSHSRARFFRAKALAEDAVAAAGVRHTIVAPSIVYSPGDPWLTLLARLGLLPFLPVSGSGQAVYQPIWADDVADCVMQLVTGSPDVARTRYELAGPETLSYDAIAQLALRSLGKRRRLVHVPLRLVRGVLRATETVLGQSAFATWDEVELMEVSMTTSSGTTDAERLGVTPKSMRAVLGTG